MKKISIIAVVAAVALGWTIYAKTAGGEGTSVKVCLVGTGEISSTLSATGKAVSTEDAEVSASTAARVKEVYVKEGDRVGHGALLALLDESELKEKSDGAAESLRQAEEKARQLERNREALLAVYQAGGVSRQALEDAGHELEVARAEARRVATEYRGRRAAVEKLRVTAPFAGTVTRKGISPGEWAVPGTPVFSLSREGRRELELLVDEADAALVRVGQRVDLCCDAFPGHTWIERVAGIAPAVKKEGGANSVKVRVTSGAQGPHLKLGQQVDAKIRTAYRPASLMLPFEALIRTGTKTSVATVKEGTVHLKTVVTGIEGSAQVEILQGISKGDEVILPEGKPLLEGAAVKSVSKASGLP